MKFPKNLIEKLLFLDFIIIEVSKDIIAVILAKDPCKECIVKACCSNTCELRFDFEKFILRGSTFRERKLFAWFYAIYFPSILFLICISIFK